MRSFVNCIICLSLMFGSFAKAGLTIGDGPNDVLSVRQKSPFFEELQSLIKRSSSEDFELIASIALRTIDNSGINFSDQSKWSCPYKNGHLGSSV